MTCPSLVRTVLLVLAAGAPACSAIAQNEPASPHGYPVQGAATFDLALPPAIEVLRVKTGHLLVKPTINGHDAGWFIFDTGAGICVISKPHVEGLELKEAGEIDAVGFAAERAKVLRADSVALGPLVLENLPMIALDLSFLKQHLGEEIAGVIGYGLLSRCVAEIDLAGPTIALHDPARFELEGCAWTSADLDKFIPVVSARFEEREGLFTLDTGANDTVSFHAAAVKELDLLEDRTTTDSKIGGVGGFIATKRGRLASFELGGIVVKGLDATFEVDAKSSPDSRITGNIGVELLRRCILTTDYAQRRVAFVPRAAPKAPEAPEAPEALKAPEAPKELKRGG